MSLWSQVRKRRCENRYFELSTALVSLYMVRSKNRETTQHRAKLTDKKPFPHTHTWQPAKTPPLLTHAHIATDDNPSPHTHTSQPTKRLFTLILVFSTHLLNSLLQMANQAPHRAPLLAQLAPLLARLPQSAVPGRGDKLTLPPKPIISRNILCTFSPM